MAIVFHLRMYYATVVLLQKLSICWAQIFVRLTYFWGGRWICIRVAIVLQTLVGYLQCWKITSVSRKIVGQSVFFINMTNREIVLKTAMKNMTFCLGLNMWCFWWIEVVELTFFKLPISYLICSFMHNFGFQNRCKDYSKAGDRLSGCSSERKCFEG